MTTPDKVRAWCFTINNYTELPELHADCKYICYGEEICPTTGTPHLQGYCYFKAAKSLSAASKYFPRGHLVPAAGSSGQNKLYCSKDGIFHEYGKAPLDSKDKGRMERDRWTDIVSLARNGDFEAVFRKYPDVYATRLPVLENLHRKRPISLTTLDGEMEHEWYVGATGSGKSKAARTENPGSYIKDPETVWWDDYDFQETVIIDDFDKYQKSQGGQMKRWLDRYVFPAQVKGGYMSIRPKKIIVTSQYLPSEIWDDEKTIDAVNRRVRLRYFGVAPPSTPPRRMALPQLISEFGTPGPRSRAERSEISSPGRGSATDRAPAERSEIRDEGATHNPTGFV